MCGPWAIPIALMAAGSVAKYFGDEKAGHAQERAYEAERARQQQYTNQQQQSFQDSLGKVTKLTDPNATQDAVNKRDSVLSSAITPVDQGSYMPGSSSAPQLVADASAKAAAGTHERSSNLAKALAELGGTGDQMLTTNIGIGRNSQAIGQAGSLAAGSAAVLPSEMRAASYKGSTLRGLGSLAQMIGQAWLGASGGPAAIGGSSSGANSYGVLSQTGDIY